MIFFGLIQACMFYNPFSPIYASLQYMVQGASVYVFFFLYRLSKSDLLFI